MAETTLTQLINYSAAIKEQIKKRAAEEGGSFLVELLKPIFDYDEDIKAIRWRQYTPYFNDGEPCVFNVHFDGSILIEDLPEKVKDMSDYEDDFVSPWVLGWTIKDHPDYLTDYPKITKEWVDGLNQLVSPISRLMSKPYYYKEIQPRPGDGSLTEFMEMIFGDHAQITVTRDGVVDIEQYEHD